MKLECGCNGDSFECEEARKLWYEVNSIYQRCSGKDTNFNGWDEYEKALAKYREHKHIIR